LRENLKFNGTTKSFFSQEKSLYEYMVRYYGYYSNKSIGLHKKVDPDDAVPALIESEVSSTEFRKNWASSI
jgi:hypothetical protein